MGNSLIPNTNIEKDPIGVCGVNNQWAMYNGHRTDKNKDTVTVYMFKKKVVKKMPEGKEEFLATMKREPEVLAKLNHPNVLKVVNPVIEDAKRIGYVSEPVKTSLNNAIDTNAVYDIYPSDLETKLHILDLVEALGYLSREVRAAHLAISPENIYILPDGKWKLGGMAFSTQILSGNATESKADFHAKPGQVKLTPNIRFTAPEVTQSPPLCTFTSDMFSLGCLIYTIYKIKQDGNCNNPYLIQANSLSGYMEVARNLNLINFAHLPEEIRQSVMRMIQIDPGQRITVEEFAGNPWFKDPFLQTIKTLESLDSRDFQQQQNFLKGLNMIIVRFEPYIIKRKIIPLLNNLLKTPQLAGSILPVYFTIMQPQPQQAPYLTKEEFNELVWPQLKVLVTGKEISAQALFALLQQMELFVALLDMKEIETVFVPLLIKSLECGVQKLQDLAITQSLVIFDKIDYNVLKSQILPKVLNLCLDKNIELRKGAVLMMSKTYHIFDPNVVNNQILMMLERLIKMENNYQINMYMLTMFQGIAKDVQADVVANKILAMLVPMLVSPTFSKKEYKAYLAVVYLYMKRIEEIQGMRYQNEPDGPDDDILPASTAETINSLQTQSNQAATDFSFLSSMGQNKANANTPSMSMGKKAEEIDMSAFDDWNIRAPTTNTSSTQNTGAAVPFGFGSTTTNVNQGQTNANQSKADPFSNFSFGTPSASQNTNQNAQNRPSTQGNQNTGFGNFATQMGVTPQQQKAGVAGYNAYNQLPPQVQQQVKQQAINQGQQQFNQWGNQQSNTQNINQQRPQTQMNQSNQMNQGNQNINWNNMGSQMNNFQGTNMNPKPQQQQQQQQNMSQHRQSMQVTSNTAQQFGQNTGMNQNQGQGFNQNQNRNTNMNQTQNQNQFQQQQQQNSYGNQQGNVQQQQQQYQQNQNTSQNQNQTSPSAYDRRDSAPVKPTTEQGEASTQPQYAKNNPMRYLNMGGMGGLRGNR